MTPLVYPNPLQEDPSFRQVVRLPTTYAGRRPSSPLQRMGIETILVCSNVATATIDDEETPHQEDDR